LKTDTVSDENTDEEDTESSPSPSRSPVSRFGKPRPSAFSSHPTPITPDDEEEEEESILGTQPSAFSRLSNPQSGTSSAGTRPKPRPSPFSTRPSGESDRKSSLRDSLQKFGGTRPVPKPSAKPTADDIDETDPDDEIVYEDLDDVT